MPVPAALLFRALGDMQQAILRFDRDRFAGEVAPDVIAVLEDADASRPIDPSRTTLGARGQLFLDGDVLGR
jgi:hypothetical protein